MTSDILAKNLRAKLDQKHKYKQRKKDEKFQPDFVPVHEEYARMPVAPPVDDYEPNDYELKVMGKLPTIDEL